jgi:predicted glycoside hydrolase/deacetylase ChbG (UPF0249 family)
MANASATEQAIAIARATPSLGVGCHIVLIDGEAVLPPQSIPHLADPQTGRFGDSLPRFLAAFLRNPNSRRAITREIEAEASAQIALLQGRGLSLTHIDTHKHLHMFPWVLRPVLRAARAAGIHAVRNPFEPLWAMKAAHSPSWIRFAEVLVLRWLQPLCLRIVADEGFLTTSGTIAVVGTGNLDSAAVTALLSHLQPGTWELVTHPGYNDADLDQVRTRLRASRDIERLALPTIKNFQGIDLASFAALAPPAPANASI